MLSCYRYIELNPVRASMVSHPAEYRWSSFHANAQGEPDKVLIPHFLYEKFGTTSEERQFVYRELFRHRLEPGVIDEIRQATNGNFALGNARFQEDIS